jgi:GNAT superfamily N-acetyltransferase
MAKADGLIFRPACSTDIPTLCDLLEELFTLEADFQPDRNKQARALQLLIDKTNVNPEQPAGVVWVAERAGQVIGMCSLQVYISTAEGGEVGLVEDVIIDAAHRQQGIGRQLLSSLEAWAHERDLSRLQLLADTDNTGAIAFYQQQGWELTQLQALRKPLNP